MRPNKVTGINVLPSQMMKKYAQRRSVRNHSIVKTRPPYVYCGNIKAIAMGPTHV